MITSAMSAMPPPMTPPMSAIDEGSLVDDATTRSTEVEFDVDDGSVVHVVDEVDEVVPDVSAAGVVASVVACVVDIAAVLVVVGQTGRGAGREVFVSPPRI